MQRDLQPGYALLEVLVVTGIVALLAALLFPVVLKARGAAYHSSCLSHQRQLAASALMWAQDHEETLPPGDSWTAIIGDRDILRCPIKPRLPVGYVFNNTIAGNPLADIARPAGTILTGDGDTDDHLAHSLLDYDRRHRGRFLASYVDGHVEIGRGSFGRFVFVSDRGEPSKPSAVYVLQRYGRVVKILDDPTAMAPRFSPDGRRIVFASRRDGTTAEDLYVMNTDGTHIVRLTNTPERELCPVFSPDGRYVAYAKGSGQSKFDVFIMNADGTGQRQLTDTPYCDWLPAFSPEGDRIVYTSQTPSGSSSAGAGRYQLCAVGVDGSGQQELTASAADPHGGASFSPDGRKLVYWQRPANLSMLEQIHLINADGTGGMALTANRAAGYFSPVFIGDGSLVAFTSLRGKGKQRAADAKLYLMSADGAQEICLTTAKNKVRVLWFDWAP